MRLKTLATMLMTPVAIYSLGSLSAHAQIQRTADARAASPGGFRALAPGVEVTIPPDRQENETFGVHNIVELVQGQPALTWQPKLSPESRTLKDMATNVVFRRGIWSLEFTFKPMRMLQVDVPQPSGKMQRKLIWYMIYHVRNTGGHLRPVETPTGTYQVQKIDEPVRFIPKFTLEAPEVRQSYPDRVIPVAIAAIQQKEDPKRRLLSTVQISADPIAVSTDRIDRSVWGVATWTDVDPRIDFGKQEV